MDEARLRRIYLQYMGYGIWAPKRIPTTSYIEISFVEWLAILIHILSISCEYGMYKCAYTNHDEFSTLYLDDLMCIALYVLHITIVVFVFVWCAFHMNIEHNRLFHCSTSTSSSSLQWFYETTDRSVFISSMSFQQHCD